MGSSSTGGSSQMKKHKIISMSYNLYLAAYAQTKHKNLKTDHFATRLNTQLSTFVSYRPDPKCIKINAFLLDCSKLDFYAFPPFACLNRVLRKIYQDKAKDIVIAPD